VGATPRQIADVKQCSLRPYPTAAQRLSSTGSSSRREKRFVFIPNIGIHSPPVILVEAKTYKSGSATRAQQSRVKLASRPESPGSFRVKGLAEWTGTVLKGGNAISGPWLRVSSHGPRSTVHGARRFPWPKTIVLRQRIWRLERLRRLRCGLVHHLDTRARNGHRQRNKSRKKCLRSPRPPT
jgi:hypothetical protein